MRGGGRGTTKQSNFFGYVHARFSGNRVFVLRIFQPSTPPPPSHPKCTGPDRKKHKKLVNVATDHKKLEQTLLRIVKEKLTGLNQTSMKLKVKFSPLILIWN